MGVAVDHADEALLVAGRSDADAFGLFYGRRVDAAADGGAALFELERLSAEQRRAIEGRVLQEVEYDELARRLRCSESVVRKRVSRGLAPLSRSAVVERVRVG